MELVSIVDGKAVTTSPTIADGVGQPHRAIIRLIREHVARLEGFGRVSFKHQPFETAGGVQNREIALLNKEQATLLITYMRNNEIVHQFKDRLVRTFFELAEKKPVIDVDDPVFMAEVWLKTSAKLEQSNAENRALKLENQDLRPKGVFCDTVAKAPDAISAGDTAKLIGTGRNRLLAFMRRIKWINRSNAPYQEKIEEGFLDVKLGGFQHPDQGLKHSVTPIITGKGLIELQRLWAEDQITPPEYPSTTY